MDETANELGLFAGQKAADAAALVPQLLTADADPAADAAALTALCDWCARFSPAVAEDAPDGLLLDITGVAHLWGGEATMLDDLLRRLERQGLAARAAVADTAGAAFALARYGEDQTIAPPGATTALLAALPVAALRLTPADTAQLARLGLTRIGRLLGLPRAQLAKRFGPALLTRLDQALGRTGEALVFRRPPTPWFERLAFAEPISQLDDLVRAAGDIAQRLCARLEQTGQGARRFEIVFHRLDGRSFPTQAGLALAGRDPVRLTRLIAPKLELIDPGFGIESVTLSADDVEPLTATQARLEASRTASRADLAPLIDSLANRLGEHQIWRDRPQASHAPERSVVRRPPLEVALQKDRWDPARPRPLRLFRRPEPIEAAAPVPDDAPILFRWRGVVHRIRRSEGPERIAAEWWRRPFDEAGPGRVRDYYRVEDEAGGRFWVFRAGLYTPDLPAKWWLHGLFG